MIELDLENIIKNNIINNEIMIELLRAKTNLDWKVVGIKGVKGDDFNCEGLNRYGFVLVDETHPIYKEKNVYLAHCDRFVESEHLIVGEDCAISSNEFVKGYIRDLNWLKKYRQILLNSEIKPNTQLIIETIEPIVMDLQRSLESENNDEISL